MSKEKYQIIEKSIWLSLSVIDYDLRYYDKQLRRPIEAAEHSIWWLRCTRDIFVVLKNLNDVLVRVKKLPGLKDAPEFNAKTKALNKKVDFINHVRNKSAGHLDPFLTERAVQWAPEIFHESANREMLVFLCYRALLEASINSFLAPDGRQKLFDHEIDILYPPDRKEFFNFMWGVVSDSLIWVAEALQFFEATIIRHGSAMVAEMACIAGQTNFDLKAESDFSYDPKNLKLAIEHAMAHFAEAGQDEVVEVMKMVEQKFIDLEE
ncbi:MAG TPA: hypothetical protein DCS07_15900 [Bdellovibrionales bacterium]|nr:hypothetical protein [Bdellovibrionales bacterium]